MCGCCSGAERALGRLRATWSLVLVNVDVVIAGEFTGRSTSGPISPGNPTRPDYFASFASFVLYAHRVRVFIDFE